MRYPFGALELAGFRVLKGPVALNFSNARNCSIAYRRFYSSEASEPPSSDRKNLYWWQFKIFSAVGLAACSSYLVYVFVTNDRDFERTRRKLVVNWNSLFYGNTLSQRYAAMVNSRFFTCLSEELNRQLWRYFLNIDLNKENGFRRSDAIHFLSEVDVDDKNAIAVKFVSSGQGESRDHKLLSGCSLHEFAHLVESLVLEARLAGNEAFERELLEKLKELNRNNDVDLKHPPTKYELSDPRITGPARQMHQEVARYIKDHEHEDVVRELEEDLERNLKLLKKLQALSRTRRLTDEERRRLNNINEEVLALREELARHRHQHRKLLLI